MARIISWVKSVAVFFGLQAIVFNFIFGISEFGNSPILALVYLLSSFGIALIVKEMLSKEKKIVSARNFLLRVAFEECHCKTNLTTKEVSNAQKLYCKPVWKSYCNVCLSREFLEEEFPGAIEELIQKRLNAFDFEESHVPEDLAASYIDPEMLASLQARRLSNVGSERFVPITFTVRKIKK
jgi:hypothetical protein